MVPIFMFLVSASIVSAYIPSNTPPTRNPGFLSHVGIVVVRDSRAVQRTKPPSTFATILLDSANNDREPSSASSILDKVGLISQPIVWISLVSVGTTGGGLPAGPFGLVGAMEGLAYLTVVGWGGVALWNQIRADGTRTSTEAVSEKLSLVTIGIGLLVLVKLVTDQGCVPNAKPILDYSAYVKVCDTQQTPGFFGGSSD